MDASRREVLKPFIDVVPQSDIMSISCINIRIFPRTGELISNTTVRHLTGLLSREESYANAKTVLQAYMLIDEQKTN